MKSSPRPHSETPADPAGDARPRPPGALELLRWSAILFGVSLLVALVAIPILRWLGLQ